LTSINPDKGIDCQIVDFYRILVSAAEDVTNSASVSPETSSPAATLVETNTPLLSE